jgi:hypothetical protein
MVLCTGPRALADCGVVANAAELLTTGARIIVGEIHGTKQTPRVVGSLVCQAAKKGPVRLGLEIFSDDQPAIDRYLASSAGADDRRALFEGGWTQRTQEGIRSVAMAELIDEVRRLRRGGADVGIVAFNSGRKQSGEHDQRMAENLLTAFAREPKAIFVVLVGDLHARRRVPEIKESFMTAYLVQHGTKLIALDSRYGIGASWSCWMNASNDRPIDPNQVRCGPTVVGEGLGKPPAIVLGRTKDGTYDGVLDMGAASYSPPAAVPLTIEQEKLAAGIGSRVEARRAYESKAYLRCGELLATLPDEQRASDDGYQAACCFALADKADRAFAELSWAVDKGFTDRSVLAGDSDLASLRADPRWKALVGRLPK